MPSSPTGRGKAGSREGGRGGHDPATLLVDDAGWPEPTRCTDGNLTVEPGLLATAREFISGYWPIVYMRLP